MKQLLNRIEKSLYRTTETGKLIGNVLLLGIVLLIVVDIVLRYVFNRPLAFSVEVIEFALGILVFLGIVICTAYRALVKIDALLTRFSTRAQATINSFFYFIATVIFGLMSWQAVLYALESQDMGLVSMMLQLPYHPFIYIMAFFSLFACLLTLSQFIHFVIEATRK